MREPVELRINEELYKRDFVFQKNLKWISGEHIGELSVWVGDKGTN